MKTASDFRLSARNALNGKWGEALAAGIVASILGATSSGGFSFNFNFSDSEQGGGSIDPGTDIIDPEFLAVFLGILGVGLIIGLVFGIAFFILGSIIAPGYSKYNLDLIDGNQAEMGTLFKYFTHWKPVVKANLIRTLFIVLWTLLFIIPGIIATYNYAMVPYILAEDPTIDAYAALDKSKKMMYGNRWRLFCLEISFFGWMILCVLTCGIGGLWLTPYQQASYADFYREISGTRPEPDITFDVVEEVQP